MRRLPLGVQNAYSDLLDRLQDDAVLETGGAPVKRAVRGRDYWYARTYIGNVQHDRYLGPDTPALRERLVRLESQHEERKARQDRRRALVQMLRVKGAPRIDAGSGKVIQALARAGVFRLRGVLVGTHAFRLYPLILGVELGEAQLATEDIDVAQFHEIAVGLDDRVDPDIQSALAQVGTLAPAASLYPTQPTGYRVADTLVELLTPNRGKDSDTPIDLPVLGVHAKPLRFLGFLLADAVPAALPYRYGVLVNVPQPARYAVHKLIVATRRSTTAPAKARKDVAQAAALIEVLVDDQPDELAAIHAEAVDRGRQWRKAVTDGAKRLPADLQARLGEVLTDAA
jgi:hypothetical protein